MPLHLEVQAYKKSTSHPDEVVFDQPRDLEVYNARAAWDVLPPHFFRSTILSSGGGNGKVKLEFNSSADADKGLQILNGLKTAKT